MLTMSRWLRPRTLLAAVVLAAVFSTGCAKFGKVSGKVTQADGSPLPGGVISFIPEDSKRNPATANIKDDGTYSCDVPVGNCKVTIDNRSAGKGAPPIGAGGVSGPPKGAGGPGAKMGPGGPGGKMGPGGPGGPPGGVQAGGPGGKDVKGSNDAIGEAMNKAGAAKVGDIVQVPGKSVPINPKYFSAETSGLSLEVKGGDNSFDVKLDK